MKKQKNEIEKKNNQIKNKKLIEKLNIKYGNKFLYQIFDENDGTQFHVTFRAKCIYKANQPLGIKLKQQNLMSFYKYMLISLVGFNLIYLKSILIKVVKVCIKSCLNNYNSIFF